MVTVAFLVTEKFTHQQSHKGLTLHHYMLICMCTADMAVATLAHVYYC